MKRGATSAYFAQRKPVSKNIGCQGNKWHVIYLIPIFLAGQFFSRKNWVNCPKTMSFRIYYLKFVDFLNFPTQLLWLEAMVYLLSINSYFSNNRSSHLSWSESPVSYQLSYQDFLVNLSFSFDSNGLEVKTKNCSKTAPNT